MIEHETPRARALRDHPDFPWLEAGDVASTARFLDARAWLRGQTLRECKRAGDGNMNLTLRLETEQGGAILKQSRPWVEKFVEIEAPWDRALFEARFYERAAQVEAIADQLPRLLAFDPDARALLIEDIPGARDCTSLYSGDTLEASELRALSHFLGDLHRNTWGPPDPAFANRGMRALNRAHLFEIPMDANNGLDLDAIAPGLAELAASLRGDRRYRRALDRAAELYASDGPCLLHGDFFPGSWLRGDRGLRIIDPEFCFYGAPEVDVGCALAHLALAGQSREAGRDFLDHYVERVSHAVRPGVELGAGFELDPSALARLAATEVMRRLIGVAQLPLPATPAGAGHENFRTDLLERSREAMLSGDVEALVPAS